MPTFCGVRTRSSPSGAFADRVVQLVGPHDGGVADDRDVNLLRHRRDDCHPGAEEHGLVRELGEDVAAPLLDGGGLTDAAVNALRYSRALLSTPLSVWIYGNNPQTASSGYWGRHLGADARRGPPGLWSRKTTPRARADASLGAGGVSGGCC